MKHKNKGAWRFASRCTDWILENQGQVIANPDLESEQIKQQIKIIEGTIITVRSLIFEWCQGFMSCAV